MKNYFLAVIVSLIIGIMVGIFLGKGNILKNTGIPIIPNVTGASCNYKGRTYANGEGFKDICNSCSCQNGQVQCTLMACED